jgi:hypothetical protein
LLRLARIAEIAGTEMKVADEICLGAVEYHA